MSSFKERAKKEGGRRQDFQHTLKTKAPCPSCKGLTLLNDAECSQCYHELDMERQKRVSQDAIASGISSVEEYKSFAKNAQGEARPSIRRRPSTGEVAAYGAGYAAGVASTFVVGAAYIGRAAGLR